MLPYLALLGRILLLGYERIAVKKLGERADSLASTFLFFGIATLFLLPSLFFAKLPDSLDFLKLVALSSFVYSIAFWLYVKSLSEGEASLVSPLYNFNVFFLLLLTVVFLHESFTLFKIAGLLLLVYGATFLNRGKSLLDSLKALFTHRACLLMIAASALIAVGRTIDGFVVQSIDPLVYSFAIYFCISAFLFIYLLLGKSLGKAVELLRTKAKAATVAGAVNAYAYLLLLFAFQGIEVSIAEPFSMLGVVVTVLLASMVFKEKIRDRLVGVLVMVLGAWLMLQK